MAVRWTLALTIAVLFTIACAESQPESFSEVPAAIVEPAEPGPDEVLDLEAAPTTAPVIEPSPTPLTIPPTPTPLPIEERTLLFSGDVLSHTPVIAAALNYASGEWSYDYRPMFADVRERVSRADLAICVLETPVSSDDTGLAGYPLFNAPRQLPDALIDAGYDGCATASNHSIDKGPSGLFSTLEQMDRVGLGHAGMYRSAVEAATPRLYDLGGVVVGHLSFTYGLNGLVLPSDSPWMVDVNDPDAIAAKAAAARAAGADVVVLSIQWGNEYQRSPSSDQEFLGRVLTAGSDLDLIIGNHAHVVQPVTEVNGVPVVYGLGNSLSNQYDNQNRTGTQDGVMIEATIAGNADIGWTVAELRFAPTWVDRSTFTIVDLVSRLDEMAADDPLRPTLQASFDRTAEAVALLGAEPDVIALAD